ncbi:MAG TPA: AAA family ATPase, partial [Lentisphaeria bacterium]|nr:AAA family ATPase [Lentisphaeria bacterium]
MVREDTLAQACILLPEDHGIIFPRGCYLQDGEMKRFDEDVSGMVYTGCRRSPNGEDFAFQFYQRQTGRYILIQYNLISKALENPIFCHGSTIFEEGSMIIFSAQDEEARRMHPMQIWQTPFYSDTHEIAKDTNSFLYKIGNRDLVRGVSDCYSISRLISRPDPALVTFEDLIRESTGALDSYHWLNHEEVFNLQEVLGEIRQTGVAAIDEFEKVERIRKDTERQIGENVKNVDSLCKRAHLESQTSVDEFVELLNQLRATRGHCISLRDLRFSDPKAVESMEESLEKAYQQVCLNCVDFLLRDDAFKPYFERLSEMDGLIEKVEKLADLKPIEEDLTVLSERLDLLTDVVNNLNIDDTTKTTAIVDTITGVYGQINRTKAVARGLHQNLGKGEAAAEFAAQYQLLTQSITNFIGLCDSPDRCDELLTKIMINVEELEGRFADYDEYADKLAEKREEAYNAFNNRKQVLEEEQQRRINSLLSSANRIMRGVGSRASTFKTIDEINAYYAADLMVVKLRELIAKLTGMGDTVKADDLAGQLKASQDEIGRKLRDRLDLFEGDDNIINLGGYRFSVNTQQLALTTVFRDNDMCFHLTGTDYFEPITDPEFLETRPLWTQELVSEDRHVYRGEYLAYCILQDALHAEKGLSLMQLTELAAADSANPMLDVVQDYSSELYTEGYEKGVHDHDAALILGSLVRLHGRCGLLRYDSEARAHAMLFWAFCQDETLKNRLRSKLHSVGILRKAFGELEVNRSYVEEIREPMAAFFDDLKLPANSAILRGAAEFLYYELQDHDDLVLTENQLAADLQSRFVEHLRQHKVFAAFEEDLGKLKGHLKSKLYLVLDWLKTYVQIRETPGENCLIWEVAALILISGRIETAAEAISTCETVNDLLGQHSRIENGVLEIHFDRFLLKLDHFVNETVPMFRTFTRLRHELGEKQAEGMRLEEFKPRVMSGFVRNKLINDVYLPMVGANFAKQMGTVGEDKRTDLMGLLLLVSPPGYGKTMLMEYMSSRLGLTFMKVNGPAIGHQVTSLDPEEAPNATAREELQKLNLSLVMGNNVMIYLDDIQHLNPEFLQKFISLCDAQRKIEGVYKGVTRTYDLRGKKVTVVMAGNPYTESGEKFRIPDMLANRADTYNLGEVGGLHAGAFGLSFVENAMTSNPVLGQMANRSQQDLYRFWEIAQTGNQEGVDFDSDYGPDEVNEIVAILSRLRRVQKVVLRVNQEYIDSAAQSEDYRAEPAFKMQGSYRNMNRMAEKVFAVMTDAEVDQLVMDHYQNESQTLTTGAEANVLKFKSMLGWLNDEDTKRWNEICREFNRRQMLAGADEQDKAAQIVNQLSGFNSNLDRFREAVEDSLKNTLTPIADATVALREQRVDLQPLVAAIQTLKADPLDLTPIVSGLQALKTGRATAAANSATEQATGLDEEDLLPLIEQLNAFNQGLAEIRDVITVATNADTTPRIEFPAEYAKAWSDQQQLLGSLQPVLQTFQQQSELFLEFKTLIQSLLSGKIQVEMK